MNAIEFVKKFGWGVAIDCVMEHGSVDHAKKYAESDYTAPEVKQFLLKVINLVEQCQ